MYFSSFFIPISFLFVAIILVAGLGFTFLRTQGSQSNQYKVLGEATETFKAIELHDFKQALSDDSIELLDIRTHSEVAQGKLPGAKVLDYYDPTFIESLAQLDRSKTYFLYCNSGNRTKSAVEHMKRMGFTSVFDLKGGIQAWIANGLEVCTNC